MDERFANGAGFTAVEIFVAIACTGVVVSMLCAGFVWLSAYKGLAKERVDGQTFGLAVLRVVLLILVLCWLFLPKPS